MSTETEKWDISKLDHSAREKAAETRRLNAAKINNKKKLRRRRIKGEVSSMSIAIANMCRECMGFEADGHSSLAQCVEECPATECHLWPWRTGRLDITKEEELW